MAEYKTSGAAQLERATGQTGHHSRWQWLVSILLTCVIGALLWYNRAWLGEAIGLARTANPALIGGALVTILLSYLVSAQVFRIGLRAYGLRVGMMRLWATTITAIVISQSFPAGGVGSYAFFISAFKRQGVAPGRAALLAALEALSYAGAMLLIGTFSIVYLAAHTLGGNGMTESIVGPIVAAAIAASVLATIVFVLTRSEATLTRYALGLTRGLQRLLRRPRNDDRAHAVVSQLVRGRALIMTQRRTVVLVVLMQMVALCGHSLALMLVLWSLHVSVSFALVLATFGVALITSTFNVLPGGGGTVEAVLVTVLLQFGVGAAAVPAAIVFRLLNFWAMLPLAGAGYGWLMRRSRVPSAERG